MEEPKMREPGWLQKVFEEAGKRVDDWPEWKKQLESKHEHSDNGHAQTAPASEGVESR